MAWLACKIAECRNAKTKKGKPYLKLTLDPGGWVSCFYEELFDRVRKTYQRGGELMVEIEESDVLNGRGDPYMNLVDLDLEGQQFIPGTEPETAAAGSRASRDSNFPARPA